MGDLGISFTPSSITSITSITSSSGISFLSCTKDIYLKKKANNNQRNYNSTVKDRVFVHDVDSLLLALLDPIHFNIFSVAFH